MAQFRVGCVPFVNARPLAAVFDQPNEFVEVLYDVPSKLPEMLDSGNVDAILVSSIELLRRKDLLPVSQVGIMSTGPVMSVRLLSKVPLDDIKSLALDQSSMTSNMLAQVLLAEMGIFPSTSVLEPNAPDMLEHHDACVIIGDKGFEADGAGLTDIDLGRAWTEMTGLPFVWALWLGKASAPMTTGLLGTLLESAYYVSGFAYLHHAILLGSMSGHGPEMEPEFEMAMSPEETARRKFVIDSAVERSSWTFEQTLHYLTHGVCFFHHEMVDALSEFARLVNKHGLAEVEVPLAMRKPDVLGKVANLLPGFAN